MYVRLHAKDQALKQVQYVAEREPLLSVQQVKFSPFPNGPSLSSPSCLLHGKYEMPQCLNELGLRNITVLVTAKECLARSSSSLQNSLTVSCLSLQPYTAADDQRTVSRWVRH